MRFEACSEFHRFDPMEVIATADEMRQLLAQHAGEPLLVFPEDRRFPIRMTDDLPQRWIVRGPGGELAGEAWRNECFAFQLGLYAANADVNGVSVTLSALTGDKSRAIPASALNCLNLTGTDWLGRELHKSVSVPAGKVQALWCGVQVPAEAAPGVYRGSIGVSAEGGVSVAVPPAITVRETVLPDGGVSDLSSMARLKWLDSTIGLDEEVTAPYTPLEVEGRTVRCLGRTVRWNEEGLIDSIRCGQQEVLAAPLGMSVEAAEGPATWQGAPAEVTHQAPGVVTWSASRQAGLLSMSCEAKMEADGYVSFAVTLTADAVTEVQDIRLDIPLRREVATYMMGLGKRGGLRPGEWRWKWDAGRANNMVWVGDVHAGLYCKLKGPQDEWHLWASSREPCRRGATMAWAGAM